MAIRTQTHDELWAVEEGDEFSDEGREVVPDRDLEDVTGGSIPANKQPDSAEYRGVGIPKGKFIRRNRV